VNFLPAVGHEADFDRSVLPRLLSREPGDRSSSGSGLRPVVPYRGDWIGEVCGIAAADILLRCAQIRAMRSRSSTATQLARPDVTMADVGGGTRWRLLDFGDGSREEFIDAVHLVLLRRKPYANEAGRRIAQLRSGRTRLEIILRLATSAEGRRLKQPSVAGFGFPVLLRVIRGLEYMARLPIFAPALRAIRR
jgi:hypothetical protein